MNTYGLKTEKLPDFVKEKITEMGIIQSSMQVDAPVTKEETVYTDDEEDVVTQAIIGGADAPTEVRLQDDTDQKENTDAADKTDEDYGTEESAYDGTTGEITAESGWTPVGDKIRIQIK